MIWSNLLGLPEHFYGQFWVLAIGNVEKVLSKKLVNGTYSKLLLRQLTILYIGDTEHFESVMQEIAILENAPDATVTRTKPASLLQRPPLTGLWHKHYFYDRFIPGNLVAHWQKWRVENYVSESFRIGDTWPPEASRKIAEDLMQQGYIARGEQNKLTGEWIVFARVKDKNFYITLGVYGNDEVTLHLVRDCFDEFPALRSILYSARPCT